MKKNEDLRCEKPNTKLKLYALHDDDDICMCERVCDNQKTCYSRWRWFSIFFPIFVVVVWDFVPSSIRFHYFFFFLFHEASRNESITIIRNQKLTIVHIYPCFLASAHIRIENNLADIKYKKKAQRYAYMWISLITSY